MRITRTTTVIPKAKIRVGVSHKCREEPAGEEPAPVLLAPVLSGPLGGAMVALALALALALVVEAIEEGPVIRSPGGSPQTRRPFVARSRATAIGAGMLAPFRECLGEGDLPRGWIDGRRCPCDACAEALGTDSV